MHTAFLVMAAVLVVLLAIAYHRDPHLVLDAAKAGGGLFSKIFPMLVLAFFVAGLVEVLLPRDLLLGWVGKESGWRGLFVGTVLGAITPGGPFIHFPIVASLFRAGADVGPLVAYVSAWALIGINRVIIYEIPLLGPKITFVRLGCSFMFPPLIGFLARLVLHRL
jgi:uncharacterized membrane protein YraQ (UPF0718 family)